MQKGIDIIKQKTPGFVQYFSKQRVFANLTGYAIEIRAPRGSDRQQLLQLLGRWLKGKKIRRLAYVIGELILMPLAALLTPVPGPNVAFYLLVVLFYFHLRAFLHLRKIRVESLDLTFTEKTDA